jgi:hypothetical protein
MILRSSVSSSEALTQHPLDFVPHQLTLLDGYEAHPLAPADVSNGPRIAPLSFSALRVGPIPTVGPLIDVTKEHSDVRRYRTHDSSLRTHHIHSFSEPRHRSCELCV